ncbi:mRNA splicing protein YJU2 KNAG_0E03500 [Huiozyma naganishii CBS 8797]|uniref:Splicing factor YJU2 n=1 Tax=Huiozyma naganishii (strain ATCC MYA-139 / BCRC 22969 / CBS 8797 / KCTC 17520 / NBRC 10181 / NCYC 3082 / Yp74L-3) TaxID=1071383 RepID=J7RZH1_HUIN7|nr:hypothetical protein KNAG_0E03500 [Kazachstania naganishii CBS 8797]CCK70607.1 hypothetical protein KNAG_0E03500 [Kazachstania naganishii CBS 8797]
MSERKAINKYYPPDYNPMEAGKKAKKAKGKQRNSVKIRLMTPFSIRCLSCSEYIPEKRKFNADKETLQEKYLESIKMYKFTFRCPRCDSRISFRTDPKSNDYVINEGGERNYVRREDEAAKAKEETIDETLERVAKEYDAKVGGKGGQSIANGTNKVEELESQLDKLQRQQENDEKLEQLMKHNAAKMRRHTEMSTTGNNHDQDIDEAVERAFGGETNIKDDDGSDGVDVVKDENNFAKNKSKDVETSLDLDELVSMKKIKLKLQKRMGNSKPNSLGIKRKVTKKVQH